MEFKNRLKELIEEKNEGSQKKLSLATNIPASTINCWFTKDIKPTYVQIIKLAKYFDVSADYLLGLEDDFGAPTAAPMGDGLTSEERELLNLFRELSPYLKGMTLDAVRSWAKKNDNGEQKKA